MHGSCRQRRQLTSRICATPASATATEAAATSKTSLLGSNEAHVKAPAPSRLQEAAQAIGGTDQSGSIGYYNLAVTFERRA